MQELGRSLQLHHLAGKNLFDELYSHCSKQGRNITSSLAEPGRAGGFLSSHQVVADAPHHTKAARKNLPLVLPAKPQVCSNFITVARY